MQARLAALDVEHSPVADTEVGSALVFRDPDHIQLELWGSAPREPTAATKRTTSGLMERASTGSVAETVQQLVEAATVSGVTVFAAIDHANRARSVGLALPETQVLILGNPAAGTPAMLGAPDLALELPTRLLAREAPTGTAGSTVVSHDPEAIARRYGLAPEQVGGLEGIVVLVDRVLGSDPRG